MAKQFKIKIGKTEYSIEMDGNVLTVNGTPFVVGTQGDMVTLDGIAYNVKIEDKSAIVDGTQFNIETSGFKTRAASNAKTAIVSAQKTQQSKGSVLSVMSGAITKILVKVGDTVEPNSVLMILEAMKMENEITAERSGTIKKIHVKVGNTVEDNQPLVDIE